MLQLELPVVLCKYSRLFTDDMAVVEVTLGKGHA